MILPLAAELAVGEIAEALNLKNFDRAISLLSKSRCSVGDIEEVLAGQTACAYRPPVARWDVLPIIADLQMAQWSVFVPLWNEVDYNQSDLQVRLAVKIVNETLVIELDDIVVP